MDLINSIFSAEFWVWIDSQQWIFPLLIGILGSLIAVPLWRIIQAIFATLFSKVLILQNAPSRAGVYDCDYYIPWKPGKPPIRERIYLTRLGTLSSNSYRGFVINHFSEEFRSPKKGKPQLRVVGEFYNERSFVGYWHHPLENRREVGSFNLEDARQDGCLRGEWSGKSGTYNRVLSGSWVWTRVENEKYGLLDLYKERYLGIRKEK